MTQTITEAILEHRATIASATVYHLGTLLSTYAALSPEALESDALTRVFHATGSGLDELLAVVDGLAIGAPSENAVDARWGLVFASAGGERTGAIYINEFGSVISDGTRSFELPDSSEAMATLRAAYGMDGVVE